MSTSIQTASQPAFEQGETTGISIGKLGVWWFLASEIMVFGGLIGTYILFRIGQGGWADQAEHVNWRLGAINTLVLVTSSFTMILALGAGRSGRRERAAKCLFATVMLGLVFLGIKAFEYSHEISEGFTPSAGMFWSFYFVMTGLHALHMIGGITLNFILYLAAVRGTLWSEHHEDRLEFAGLYWHFVDVVWIFLFPLLYLS
jgi:cytochrome c oxidase subunit III